jgi:hypothetical protein
MTHEEFHAMRQEIAALRRQMQGVYDYVVAERQRQQQAWVAASRMQNMGPPPAGLFDQPQQPSGALNDRDFGGWRSVDDGTRGPNGQIGESQAEYFGYGR